MSKTQQLKRLFVLVGSLALFVLTAAASAAGPTHFQFSDSGTDFAPAGELCDFDYTASFTVEANVVLFGDPDNPTKIIDYVSLAKTHTNADTGYSLSEVDHFAEQVNAGAEQVKQVGVFWHLRDSSGKLVVVQAGQILVDTSTGEIVKVTPNFNPDFAAVICPALGGSPAI
jgi:hypothetical protein